MQLHAPPPLKILNFVISFCSCKVCTKTCKWTMQATVILQALRRDAFSALTCLTRHHQLSLSPNNDAHRTAIHVYGRQWVSHESPPLFPVPTFSHCTKAGSPIHNKVQKQWDALRFHCTKLITKTAKTAALIRPLPYVSTAHTASHRGHRLQPAQQRFASCTAKENTTVVTPRLSVRRWPLPWPLAGAPRREGGSSDSVFCALAEFPSPFPSLPAQHPLEALLSDPLQSGTWP